MQHDCPGIPNKYMGFQDLNRWSICYGEVFKVYAHGKALGAPISNKDFIILYNVSGDKCVSLWHQNADLQTCPGPINTPPYDKYECGEVFAIIVKREY